MNRRTWDKALYSLAEAQGGYFTAAQARAAGVKQVRLVQLNGQGVIERVTRGVYRLTNYPVSALGQYMEAALWPQVRRRDAHGIVSHESALAIYGLSNASPAKIHLTVSPQFRIRRVVPKQIVLHYQDLEPTDVHQVEGVPVTTPARAIRDVHREHLGPSLVRQAIEDGRRTGHLTFDEADRLEKELLGVKRGRQKRRSKR